MPAPSANWLALKRTLATSEDTESRPKKRRKLESHTKISNQKGYASKVQAYSTSATTSSLPNHINVSNEGQSAKAAIVGDPDSIENLAAMILKPSSGAEHAKPTKFLALDCEMVGVGPYGIESALARVTIVNFVGDVIMDEFVLPQETVTDWRTHVSGVRKEDMANAKPFAEIQTRVSELLKDRYLVGHALKNDLDALLLSHPWLHTRDTQAYHVFKTMSRSKRPSLRKLVKTVFGITIQEGEHNSVIDARAPMALYRLYRKQWETGGVNEPSEATNVRSSISSIAHSISHKPDTSVDQAQLPSSGNTARPEEDVPLTKNLARLEMPSPVSDRKRHILKDISKSRTLKPLDMKSPRRSTGVSSGLSVIVTRHAKKTGPRAARMKEVKTSSSYKKQSEESTRSTKEKTSSGWWKAF